MRSNKIIPSNLHKKYSEVFDRYKTLKILFKKKITVFDIGANEGQTILQISKNFPKSTIHCFEPQESCKKKLNYLKNKLKSLNIYLNFFAVGDKNCKKLFFVNERSDLSSFNRINYKSKLFIKMKTLRKNKKNLKKYNSPIIVDQVRLDKYIKKNKVKKIDILKIDTQAYDDLVLKGISKKYFKNINTIIVEINLWDLYDRQQSFLQFENILKS